MLGWPSVLGGRVLSARALPRSALRSDVGLRCYDLGLYGIRGQDRRPHGGTRVAPTQFGGPGMAWIEQRRRANGGLTARVFWRPSGARDALRDWETFGAGSDAQNLARADGFKRMVEAAGQRWPDGWVKGEGFVRPLDVADPMTPPRRVRDGPSQSPRPWPRCSRRGRTAGRLTTSCSPAGLACRCTTATSTRTYGGS
jgi:hypothetical protein